MLKEYITRGEFERYKYVQEKQYEILKQNASKREYYVLAALTGGAALFVGATTALNASITTVDTSTAIGGALVLVNGYYFFNNMKILQKINRVIGGLEEEIASIKSQPAYNDLGSS